MSKVVEVKPAAAKPEKSPKKKAVAGKVVKAVKEVVKKVQTTPTKEKTAPTPYSVKTRSAKKKV